MTEPKAAGYIRVSSKEQVDGESLSTQRQSIKNYCKANGYKLVKIYADEGISGGTVKERHSLLQCLYDGQDGKFDTLVIHRLSRFGRNARELLNNHNELQTGGISLRSISEGIDFGNKYGKAMLGMFAVMAELERDIIREQMLENRIARGQKGIPTAGQLPFGRTFNRKTNEWELDTEKARLLQWAADEYLKGGSLRDISETLRNGHKLPLGYHYLITVLSQRCGDTWTVTFQDQAPIVYQIPRILDDHTIQRVRERLEHNRIECRKDVRKYVLTGFIRCEACGKSLSGQTQINKYGTQFKYYNHPGGKHEKCKAFNSVPLKPIETAVFETIFENIMDAPAFEKAIQESLPDEQMIESLKSEIKDGEKGLKRINKELDRLVDAVLSGVLEKDTIKSKEQSLLQTRKRITEDLEQKRDQLNSMPDLDKIKLDSQIIRRKLLEEYSGSGRLRDMSFDDKKNLLHFLFDGKDQHGTPYGIYVAKKDKGPGAKIDYFIYGRLLTGLRTLKGDDINYQGWDEDGNDNSGNTGSGPGTQSAPKTKCSYNGKRVYNTNCQACLHNHDLHSCSQSRGKRREKPSGRVIS
ncbi:recombinase family protein [Desulfobacter postgatei]|uniref:Site-specific recombinase, DNA invertase Pin n=1 Tax=Desulfobacter postgatei 2ac9 TaxID=879212 RepID=I5B7M6_9BACT|nr:recombinase family protein [Desulfobacter postgatei]EIM65489.1 site-specific recombinase, DNA invertase Pin [Desulfobacter postgatei 2ac9]